MDRWLTIEQIAKYLQVSRFKIYELAQKGKIPASKVGRMWRFKKERIDDWLKKQENNLSKR